MKLRSFLKWSLGIAASMVVLAVAVPAAVWLQSETVIARRYPLSSTTAEASIKSAAIARGAHLVAIAGCVDCHSANLEGRLLNKNSLLPVWSSNLRLLAQRLSDEELERAIRTGISSDSTSTWDMPAMDYTYMSEDDVVAIVSYLRTLKPAGSPAPGPNFDMPARFAIVRGDIEPIADRTSESPTSLDLGPRYDGGRYLARISCSDCHGTDLTGSASARDLTAVAPYSREAFFGLLRVGKAPDGRALPTMSLEVQRRFHAFHDYEIDALYDYLVARARVLKPTDRNTRAFK